MNRYNQCISVYSGVAMLSKMRDYQKLDAKDSRIIRSRLQDGLESQLLVIQTPFGYRRVGGVFFPEGKEKIGAGFFLHWDDPEYPGLKYNQFFEEGEERGEGGGGGGLDVEPQHVL